MAENGQVRSLKVMLGKNGRTDHFGQKRRHAIPPTSLVIEMQIASKFGGYLLM